jgi:hypothetical protein
MVGPIMVVHTMLAKIAPEFAIGRDEAVAMSEAIANYARHTNYRMDPRTRDLGALILCVCAIEGPRLMRVTSRRRMEAQQARAEATVRQQAPGGTIIDLETARQPPYG